MSVLTEGGRLRELRRRETSHFQSAKSRQMEKGSLPVSSYSFRHIQSVQHTMTTVGRDIFQNGLSPGKSGEIPEMSD